ncbi:hypothetical protein VP01_2599g1 [Puccinia sorghi]|uniref:Integrase catalytic domain-containing protein n=1 Tax=Puccinia sorghi TaxID=27349 RepID=A0A0L6V5A5_9BASI|nr:hypothetical protein VP01_2599g1 [Puccinia sorghi]
MLIITTHDWWRESQVKWKANKEKPQNSQANHYMLLLTLWINHGKTDSQLILDSGASAHDFNDKQFSSKLDLGSFNLIKTRKAGATLPILGQGTGCKLNSNLGRLQVSLKYLPVFGGNIKGNLYTIDDPSKVGISASANWTTESQSFQEIHEYFGHASIACLSHFTLNLVTQDEKDSFKCISALASKHFKRIHIDLIGPINPQLKLRDRYILTVVNNFTKKNWLGKFPTVVAFDRGGEFVGRRLVSLFGSNHIQQLISEPYHPKHNVLKSACIMLNQIPRKGESDLPWKLMHGMTLPETFINPLSTSTVYLLQGNKREKGQKFDEKGDKGRLIGRPKTIKKSHR